MKNNGLYAGSFDPVTNAHLDLISRCFKLFSTLYVGVAYNPDKASLFDVDQRVKMLELACKDFTNVKVISYQGLTVDWAKKHDISFLVRGIRSSLDLDYETSLSQINEYLCSDIQTIFIPSSSKYSFVSSSFIKQIVLSGGSVRGLVPKEVEEQLVLKLQNNN